MHSNNNRKLILPALLLFCTAVHTQLPEYHVRMLTEQQGLSVADIISITKDKNDFLWLASQSGIQRYDGKNAKRFELNETIESVFADNKNRKWTITRNGIYLFKNDYTGFTEIKCTTTKNIISLFNSGEKLFMLTAEGIEIFDENKDLFITTSILKPRVKKSIGGLHSNSSNNLFFCTNDSIYSFDLRSKKILALPFKNSFSIVPLNDNELLVTNWDSKTFHLSLYNSSVDELKPVEIPGFSKNNFIRIFSGVLLNDNRFLLATTWGLLYYDMCTRKFTVPVIYNKGSEFLLNNSAIRRLYRDNEGTIYMAHPEGISFFSPMQNPIHFLKSYKWKDVSMPDIDIRSFADDEKGNTWLATLNGLSSINMSTGKMENFFPGVDKESLNYPSIRALLFYKRNLWVGTGGKGLWIFNPQTKKFSRPVFNTDSTGKKTEQLLNEDFVWKLSLLPNGDVFVAGGSGGYRINGSTNVAERINASLGGSRSAIIDSSGRIWHGSIRGIKCYDSSFKLLFSIRDSLVDKRVAAIIEWDQNNFFIGSRSLYTVSVKNNRPSSFHRVDAIPSNRFIYSMEKDKIGNIWIGTDEGLYRYNPVSNEAILLDASDNIQPQAFNSNGLFLNNKGILFAGGKSGFNYFDPSKFYKLNSSLLPSISSVSVGDDDSSFFSNSGPFETDFLNRSLLITISSPEYTRPYKIQYRFKLNKKDEWIPNGNNNTVRLFNLHPGRYNFIASVSLDGKEWFECKEPLLFTILKPWWQQWWFRGVCILAAFSIIGLISLYRKRKRTDQENKRTIEYFSNSGHEHSTVEDILWDITRNCISRLGFEECVIYLLDEERMVLVQKAAYGSKSPKNFEIVNPIEIQMGKGIVGHVAKTGVAEIINDTSKDKRYIVDDDTRYSEITVPIIYNEKIIGVIDSEHKRKNFFTKKHLELLQTIAAISSTKISKGIVTERMRQAKKELTELSRKMLETQFLNLRLQMNPHFLFNSLSSIQHLVVSNQTNEAYKYLTVFSHFLRSVLKYADKTFITLKEEIQMLEMYIKLESLGFDKSFKYDINIDDNLDVEDILIPPLMIQPLIENAIWHGLVHKDGEKYFSVKFYSDADENLVCIVEDNGVGRKQAKTINSASLHVSIHESKATQLLQQRLELLTEKTSKEASVCYNDKYDGNHPAGTKVQVIIPYYNTVEI